MKKNAIAFEAVDQDELHKAGAYRFITLDGERRQGIRFGCPCGCGLVGAVWFAGTGIKDGGPEWQGTGEWPRASLTPSIGYYGQNSYAQGYHWHGWLRDGVFEEC